MSPVQSNPGGGGQDVPPTPPQTTPKLIGYGHPEYNFVQGLMELNSTVARMQAVLEQVKQASDDTKAKVARLEQIAYAGAAIIVIAVAVGGWMLNTAKDFALTYYRASIEAQARQTQGTSSPPAPATGAPPAVGK